MSADEIVLPGGKRALMTAMEGMFAFTDDQRMALVFDFTPASSVTVVDLVKRQVLGDIDIPGCSLVYPTGARGFSTLCSSGTLLTVRLDAKGAVAGRSESKAFNPLDTDPLFTSSALVGGVRYFPSLHGRVQPIDMKTDDVKVLPDWSLVSAAEQAAHWRPSGWQIVASDDKAAVRADAGRTPRRARTRIRPTKCGCSTRPPRRACKRMRLVRPGSSIALTPRRTAAAVGAGGRAARRLRPAVRQSDPQPGSARWIQHPHGDRAGALMTAEGSDFGVAQLLAAQLAAFLAALLLASAAHKGMRPAHTRKVGA